MSFTGKSNSGSFAARSGIDITNIAASDEQPTHSYMFAAGPGLHFIPTGRRIENGKSPNSRENTAKQAPAGIETPGG